MLRSLRMMSIKKEQLLNVSQLRCQESGRRMCFGQKTIWRIIDLREKVNQQFYYPTRDMQGRSNLVNLILKGINEKKKLLLSMHHRMMMNSSCPSTLLK